jgi:hypothetical protein
VLTVDNEANCFPNSHVYYSVLGAILVRHGGAGRLDDGSGRAIQEKLQAIRAEVDARLAGR